MGSACRWPVANGRRDFARCKRLSVLALAANANGTIAAVMAAAAEAAEAKAADAQGGEEGGAFRQLLCSSRATMLVLL